MNKEIKIYNWLILPMKRIWNFTTAIITKTENSHINFGTWFFSILSFLFLRSLLETFSTGGSSMSASSWEFLFLHEKSFYFFTILSFILAIHFATGERIEKISKASLWMAPLFLLPPIIDLIVFQGKHVAMPYLQIGFEGQLDVVRTFFGHILFGSFGFLQFFGSHFEWAKSLPLMNEMWTYSYGIKIELIIISFLIAMYVFWKTSSIINTLFFIILSKIVIIITSLFPSFFALFLGLSESPGLSNNFSQLNSSFSWQLTVFSLHFIAIFIFSVVWFWRYDKIKFLALVKNIRIERLCLYLGAFFYGIYLAAPNFKFNFSDIVIVIMACLAIVLSWLFAVGSNDLADEKGDAICKPDRPLPSGKMSHSETKTLNLIFRVASYICAFVAGYAFFITILIRSCISYLYSNPPFRLKKFPMISSFCIASAVLLGILGGFLLFSEKTIFDFPFRMILFILTFFTLGMNFIHIKDREGDEKERVWTLAVIFGKKWGKIVIATCLALAFLSVILFYSEMPKFAIPFFIGISAVGFWTVAKKNFKEWQVIFVCAIFAMAVVLFIERPLWELLWK